MRLGVTILSVELQMAISDTQFYNPLICLKEGMVA